MSNVEIVRAWKDPELRKTLTQAPPLPIGLIELNDPYLTEEGLLQGTFTSVRGEHTTVTGCNNCTLTQSCSSQCQTHVHCPHTGWQCGALEMRFGLDGE